MSILKLHFLHLNSFSFSLKNNNCQLLDQLQIDLSSAMLIEGIILYSWYEIERTVYQNQYNYSLREYGRHSIILEYSVINETFIRYNRKVSLDGLDQTNSVIKS